MKWFMDTEFDENGTTIKLISIALVCENGFEYYAVASDGWRAEDCDPWVREHVVAKLPDSSTWKTRVTIRNELRELLLSGDDKPEIWAYFADYDWVAFCQLFGRMIDLPKGMPMWCRDLKQVMEAHGWKREQFPTQSAGSAHNALEDARWTRDAWELVSSGVRS